MSGDPLIQFASWLEKARHHSGIIEPTAMALATTDTNGQPSLRMVLLKNADEDGFVFYTNMESRKGRELKANPKAALCFYWMPLLRQVRVEGHVEEVSAAEADAYFASRPRESQIGAWASKQSQPLSGKIELVEAVARETLRFNIGKIPRPPHWSGWRLIPQRIEFWQQGEFRLHDRELYTRTPEGWSLTRLYP